MTSTPAPSVLLRFGTLYHWFLVALALLCTRLMSGTVGAIVVPVAVLLALGLAGTIERVRGWVPTALAGATDDLVRDGDPSRFVPGVLVTLAASVLAAHTGIRLTRRREL
jgi:hypothetical protein